MEQIRLLRPEFVINVGDLIEGGTEDRARLEREWDSFDARANRAIGPVFYVGGNHDLINPVQWQVWEDRHGPRYYHFRYKDVLFLVLDTEDNPAQRQAGDLHGARQGLRAGHGRGLGNLVGNRVRADAGNPHGNHQRGTVRIFSTGSSPGTTMLHGRSSLYTSRHG